MKDDRAIRVPAIPVSLAKKRLPQVIEILNEMKVDYDQYMIAQTKLKEVSNSSEPQEIAKQRFELDQKEEILHERSRELLELDCVLKDFSSGLVDFVGIRNDTPVWLCYKRGEKGLKYYHEWNAQFVGRQPIDFD